jgi:hypothetical protein
MAGVIARLRAEIAGLNERVFASPVLRNPDLDSVKRFIANQLYIVPHDLKALSAAIAKARSDDEISFVKSLVDGDYAAAKPSPRWRRSSAYPSDGRRSTPTPSPTRTSSRGSP